MASPAISSTESTLTRILVTSPNDEFRSRVSEQLLSESCLVEEAIGGADTLEKLEALTFGTVFLDRRLTDLHAEEVASILRKRRPLVRIVFVDSEEDSANAGTISDLVPSELRSSTQDAPGAPETGSASIDRAEPDVTDSVEVEPLPGMLGSHASMQRIFRMARLVAPRNTTVLITGETGTGKELVAVGIHQISPRRNGPFVVVNCAAIPEALIEAELFGHARGAFTGAVQSRLGRIHAAHGGTLFLDEVGDLPLNMQAKLLRFLQHGEVQRLGSSDVFRVDVRVVAATNARLKERVAEKQFRSDLYYRLAVFPISLPNLSTRQADILPLAERFIEKLSLDAGMVPKSVTPGAAALLQRYPWPGNVRELEHVIERAFILAEERAELSAELFETSFDESTLEKF